MGSRFVNSRTPETIGRQVSSYSVSLLFFSLHLRRNPQRHQKPRHHVVSRNCTRQLDKLRRVEVLAQCIKNLVGHFHIQRHLRGIANHQLLDGAQRRVRRRLASVGSDHCVQRIKFSLRTARSQKIRRMVLVFVGGTRQQRYGADGEFAQFGAGGQVGAYGF